MVDDIPETPPLPPGQEEEEGMEPKSIRYLRDLSDEGFGEVLKLVA
jgi:hypothetical protein